MRVCLENQEFSRSSSTKFQDDFEHKYPGGCTFLHGLYGDVALDRVWFLTSLGFTISCQFFPV